MEKIKNGFIYKIVSPSNKIYIGMTTDLKTRISKYRNLNCKGQIRIYRSIKKYGWDYHIFEIIEEIKTNNLEKDLKEAEIKWIKYFDSFQKGLNCTMSGDGNSGRQISDITKNKISKSNTGKKHSQETIDKRVKKITGLKRTQEFKDKISKAQLGRPKSEETKEKLRIINTGKVSPNRIACKLINIETKETRVAYSLKQLSEISPLSLPTITRLKSSKNKNITKNKFIIEYEK